MCYILLQHSLWQSENTPGINIPYTNHCTNCAMFSIFNQLDESIYSSHLGICSSHSKSICVILCLFLSVKCFLCFSANIERVFTHTHTHTSSVCIWHAFKKLTI